MKSIITSALNGIIPVNLKDIEFIIEGRDEMLEAIVSMISEATTVNSYILHGVVPAQYPITTFSAGFVVLHNKIYRFDEQSYLNVQIGQQRYLRVEENILAAGEKTMKPDMTQVDTWYEYKAIMVATDAPEPNDVLYSDLKRFSDIIRGINPITSAWIPIVLNDSWTAFTDDGNAIPSYKVHHNVVYLRGCAVQTGANPVVATLAGAIKPATRLSFNNSEALSIGSDGVMLTQGITKVILDGIVYIKN